MKPTVIIVPGLSAPVWPWPFNYLIYFYLWYFELDTSRDNTWESLQEYLKRNGFSNVVLLPALGWFSNKDVDSAGKELATIIDKQSAGDIVVIGYSLGGAVIESGVNQTVNKEKLRKIILLASPHHKSKFNLPKSVKLINIYSDADRYLYFSNYALYFKKYREIENVENIRLNNLKHSGSKIPF